MRNIKFILKKLSASAAFYIFGLIFFCTIYIPLTYSSGDAVKINPWASIRAKDVALLESGWSIPQRVPVSSEDWEDGAFITGDGKKLYFAFYKGDLFADVARNKFNGDIDVYYSNYPFTQKIKEPISESIWSEGGVMISGKDKYYHSNRMNLSDVDKKAVVDRIYKNGKALELGLGNISANDPHYCAAKNELYFWVSNGPVKKEIYVYKNGISKMLPAPINEGHVNMQPFLTPDCQTMYFSSGRTADTLWIYRSKRLGENSWSEPIPVVRSKYGVGEPTLTDDGQKFFFVQLFKSPKGVFDCDIFYVGKYK